MNYPLIDETHDPGRTSWVAGAARHTEFPIQNLPLGIFTTEAGPPRPGIAVGDFILDLRATSEAGLLADLDRDVLTAPRLNPMFELPPGARGSLRRQLSQLLSDEKHRAAVEPFLHAAGECALHLPAAIGDYTDFYVGIHHATHVGRLFRPDTPLLPNYKFVPIGYHGRASSIRPSGTAVVRPRGQQRPPDQEIPTFGSSRRLDYEMELGIWIGQGNALGTPIPIDEARRHIAGYCLLNDWSARDLQAWEYQPLGPFLSKSFLTTISPWVVTAEALAPFQTAQPPRPEGDPQPLPYLWDAADQRCGAFRINLEVTLLTARMREAALPPHRLSRALATHMYWTAAQIVTHHASNGCNLNPGDLLGTGTISADQEEGYGSLLELSRGGSRPLTLPSGETRTFLEDGDEVTLSATAMADGYIPIGFGPCVGKIRGSP